MGTALIRSDKLLIFGLASLTLVFGPMLIVALLVAVVLVGMSRRLR